MVLKHYQNKVIKQ